MAKVKLNTAIIKDGKWQPGGRVINVPDEEYYAYIAAGHDGYDPPITNKQAEPVITPVKVNHNKTKQVEPVTEAPIPTLTGVVSDAPMMGAKKRKSGTKKPVAEPAPASEDTAAVAEDEPAASMDAE